MKVMNVVGARPNFMKIAPLIRAMNQYNRAQGTGCGIQQLLVHTGQHYDYNMSDSFFSQLEIPAPDINLEIGSGSHAEQTGRIMIEFEKILLQHKPDLVIVVGDVNSTIACSLVASKINYVQSTVNSPRSTVSSPLTPASSSPGPCPLNPGPSPSSPLNPIPCTLNHLHRPLIAHVEAGLRSFDRTMPEEINRILTDAISDFLFITEKSALENLRREGIPDEKIHFVGNVMIDTLVHSLEKTDNIRLPFVTNKPFNEYGVVTLHRPANVDRPETLERILDAFNAIAKKLTLVIPLHPRTRKNIESFGMADKLDEISNYCVITEPQGYFEMLTLIKHAKMVITDSGGLQEETTYLGIPCLTMRENTERPSTLQTGTSVLVGNDTGKLMQQVDAILSGNFKKGTAPELWDGRAAERIIEVLVNWFACRQLNYSP